MRLAWSLQSPVGSDVILNLTINLNLRCTMDKVCELVESYNSLPDSLKSEGLVKSAFKFLILRSLSEDEKPEVPHNSGQMLRQTTVLDYVKSHPGCTARNISSAIGYDVARINFHLGQLTKQKDIYPDRGYTPFRYFSN